MSCSSCRCLLCASPDAYASTVHIWCYLCGHEAASINIIGFPLCHSFSPNLPSVNLFLTLSPMSQTPPTAAPSSSSNFRSIFVAALEDYKNKTKNDLLQHGLTDKLERCESAIAILHVLDKQFHIQQFVQSQVGGKSLKQWLSATATVLYAFSSALGQGIGLVVLHRSCYQRLSL